MYLWGTLYILYIWLTCTSRTVLLVCLTRKAFAIKSLFHCDLYIIIVILHYLFLRILVSSYIDFWKHNIIPFGKQPPNKTRIGVNIFTRRSSHFFSLKINIYFYKSALAIKTFRSWLFIKPIAYFYFWNKGIQNNHAIS